MKRAVSCAAGVLAVCACAAYILGPATSAQQGPPNTFLQDPNTCDPAQCGKTSPLIPMQSSEAVHMGLVWKRNSDTPKILDHARFPEYVPNDVADPAIVDQVINSPRDPPKQCVKMSPSVPMLP